MLTLNNTLRNVVSFEVLAEIIPGNHTTSSGIFVLLIPLRSLVFQLERSKLDKVLRPDVATLKMFADIHEPIISVCGHDTVTERLRLVCKELVEHSKLSLIVAMALISLVTLLQELHKHLRVSVGGGQLAMPSEVEVVVTPSMRLYPPRVEARLRGIIALKAYVAS